MVGVSATLCGSIEQNSRPQQISELTHYDRLANHCVGQEPRVVAATDRLLIEMVSGRGVTLPCPYARQRDEAEGQVGMMFRRPTTFQQRFVRFRRAIEITFGRATPASAFSAFTTKNTSPAVSKC